MSFKIHKAHILSSLSNIETIENFFKKYDLSEKKFFNHLGEDIEVNYTEKELNFYNSSLPLLSNINTIEKCIDFSNTFREWDISIEGYGDLSQLYFYAGMNQIKPIKLTETLCYDIYELTDSTNYNVDLDESFENLCEKYGEGSILNGIMCVEHFLFCDKQYLSSNISKLTDDKRFFKKEEFRNYVINMELLNNITQSYFTDFNEIRYLSSNTGLLLLIRLLHRIDKSGNTDFLNMETYQYYMDYLTEIAATLTEYDRSLVESFFSHSKILNVNHGIKIHEPVNEYHIMKYNFKKNKCGTIKL